MNNDQFAGSARSIGGKIEEVAGAAFNDRSLESEGIVDQVKGAAQHAYGDAKDTIRDTYDRIAPVAREGIGRAVDVTRQNSLLAILAAGAVGFALAIAFRPERRNPWST